MLIIKAYINERQIDEIHIHNTGQQDVYYGWFKYRITEPEGYENKIIRHYRKDGWMELAKKAIKILTRGEKK